MRMKPDTNQANTYVAHSICSQTLLHSAYDIALSGQPVVPDLLAISRPHDQEGLVGLGYDPAAVSGQNDSSYTKDYSK